MPDETRQRVAAQYTDCLCRNCLLELGREAKHGPRIEAIRKMESLLKFGHKE